MYRIALAWTKTLELTNLQSVRAIVVVGCGGTGGFVADGLARLLPLLIDLVLIDMDTVEEHNLSRQSFTAFFAEIGRLFGVKPAGCSGKSATPR